MSDYDPRYRIGDSRYEYSLLMLCEDVHMDVTGSGEMSPGLRLAGEAELRERYANWRTEKSDSAYDACVKRLLRETLNEIDGQLDDLEAEK